jgi:hypothetical protein
MLIYEACSNGTCSGIFVVVVVEEAQAVEKSAHGGRHPTDTPADGLPLQRSTAEIIAPKWPQHLHLN